MERLLKSYVELVYAFMYLPVAVIALFSFNSAEMMAFPMTGFTLVWYDIAIHDGRLLNGFGNTLVIAAPTALIATALGAMAGLALTRHQFQGRLVFAVLLIVPFFIPKIILAVADVIAMAVVGIPHGVATIIAAQSLIILPFSAMVIASVLVRLDRRLEGGRDRPRRLAAGRSLPGSTAADAQRTGGLVLHRLRLVVVRVRRDVLRQPVGRNRWRSWSHRTSASICRQNSTRWRR